MSRSTITRPARAICARSGTNAREIANGGNAAAGGFGFTRDGVW